MQTRMKNPALIFPEAPQAVQSSVRSDSARGGTI